MTTPFLRLLDETRLLLFVGQGGVGKTSCAAAAALEAARRGRHVAVLTIDPAPRLGDALGVAAFDEEPHAVRVPQPLRPGGLLVAMRLDTRRTFDRTVELFAPGQSVARAILEHPIYQALAGSLGGSDCYMALQRLHELQVEQRYELLVIDTPPAAHAEQLLSAPARLTDLLDTGAMRVIMNPTVVLGRAGSLLARATLSLLLSALERVTGTHLQAQVADFVSNFEHVLQGLNKRAEDVDALLKANDTCFVQVVRPRPGDVQAALAFRASLAARAIPIDIVVVNRVGPAVAGDRTLPAQERLAGAPAGTLEAVTKLERQMDELRSCEARAIAHFRQESAVVMTIGALEHDVRSTADLCRLGCDLCDAEERDGPPERHDL